MPIVPKPAHVTIPILPTPPKPPSNIDPDRLVRQMEVYGQQLAVWEQQTLAVLTQQTLASFRDAINYILDQLP